MKPRRFALLLLVVLSLLAAACAPPATQAPADQPTVQEPAAEPTAESAAEPAAQSSGLSGEVVVGCAHALSGPIAIYGEPIRNGIMLAAKQINDQKLQGDATLSIVCEDTADGPGRPAAFVAAPGQGVNYPRNRWHGVLTPVGAPQDFAVVDRAGEGTNLEEFHFDQPWTIHVPQELLT